jgi:hypothetical protein
MTGIQEPLPVRVKPEGVVEVKLLVKEPAPAVHTDKSAAAHVRGNKVLGIENSEWDG